MPKPRPVAWVGSSKEALKTFPEEVKDLVGYALYQALVGFQHRHVKPLKGLGSNILEVISRHDGNAFRAVYTGRFKVAVYVLHVFQKKATRGIATPKPEIDLIKRRLRAAEQHHRENYGGGQSDED